MIRSSRESFFHRPTEALEGTRTGQEGRLRKGLEIADYRLIECIGKGGMGEVWKAAQRSLGDRLVALKFMRPEFVTERLLEFFRREARAAGRLNHPGLVVVHAYGETDGLAWISMEYVEGGFTLRDYLAGVSPQEALLSDYDCLVAEVVAAIAEAMQAAHEVGVIHRDLKPENVLITPDDRPKVMDFGLARLAQESSLSTPGDFAGTFAYASPEQLESQGEKVDQRADVYSLGVILFEMLTLRHPFEGDTPVSIMRQLREDGAPDPRRRRPEIPAALAKIVVHAMNRDPDQRVASMRTLASELQHFARNVPGPGAERSAVRPETARESSHSDPTLLQNLRLNVPCWVYRRTSLLRIACPVFLRLEAENRYFLIRVPDESHEHCFLPIGGILKHRTSAELTAVAFEPDSPRFADLHDFEGDLRGCIQRKSLPRFRRWFFSGSDRESDDEGLRREILEELTKIEILNVEDIVSELRLHSLWSIEQSPTPTPGRRYWYQYRRTAVLAPQPSCVAATELRRRLIAALPKNPHIVLASAIEIVRGRTDDGEPIAHNAPHLFGQKRRPGEPGEL